MSVGAPPLTGLVHAHFRRSRAAAATFFTTQAPAIAAACERLADRFAGGGTLFVFGAGARTSDAQHVSVEFLHPVIVGKRALPAISLTSDAAIATASAEVGGTFASALRALAGPRDILLCLCGDGLDAPAARALAAARDMGILTVLLAGRATAPADVHFAVEDDPLVVQEVHETLYHVLWELVHVFLDQGAGGATGSPVASATEPERALYPFLFEDGPRAALEGARRQVHESILSKARDVSMLREAVELALADRIADAGRAIAQRVRRGGRLLAFGNGGSATDAQDAAADCMNPPFAAWRPIPSLALTNDIGVLTAVGNDVGFEHVYARQVSAFGRPIDAAIGFTTSGTSRSVVAALDAAKARGLLTIALSGNDGGTVARSPSVDICLTAPSTYTPRIQEAHATMWHAMLAAAQNAGDVE